MLVLFGLVWQFGSVDPLFDWWGTSSMVWVQGSGQLLEGGTQPNQDYGVSIPLNTAAKTVYKPSATCLGRQGL